MAIALLDAPWKAGAVLAVYFLIQQLEQYLLVPTVMAKQVSLLPAVTLLSQIIFAIFFGFLGLLLALPLVIVGQIWIKEVLVKDVLDRWDAPPKKLS
jgi:predicted PurR-regulated permease PerM